MNDFLYIITIDNNKIGYLKMENLETKLDRLLLEIETRNKQLDDVIKKFIFSPATLSAKELYNLYVWDILWLMTNTNY